MNNLSKLASVAIGFLLFTLELKAQIKAYTTALNTNNRITLTDTLYFKSNQQPLEKQVCVFIDVSKTFQTIEGIGGAITDASAEVFYKLPLQKQKELATAYFDLEKGIGYSLARTNMQSCDFSSDMYSYVAERDSLLKTFNIDHDRKFKIPLIKEALNVAKGELKLFFSPWSPPAWMKDNNSTLNGGKLLPSYAQSWANFYPEFIKRYEKEGIIFWGLTVQNEPMAKQTWESCIYTANEERDFVNKFLGPTLKKEGFGDKKLIVWDHNRDLLYQRAETVLADANASQYVWGVGFHWYETWTGGTMQFDNVKRVAESYPTKKLIFTEGSIEHFDANQINDWAHGEKYAYSMINDFNSGVVAWTDWNILLDEHGGPNHVGNFCFAPVHANTKTGELTYTNSYYYLGHFSKFIRPGAKRVSCSSNRTQLETTAFLNKDNRVVVIVLNRTDDNIPFRLYLDGQMASIVSSPHSIKTLVLF